jgi:DNA-binding PadR family transcriptional regulator
MGKYSIGKFEQGVMITVALLYENAYGISIKEEIAHRLNRSVSISATRTALSRLERKGFLSSDFGEATAIRGGKRKRYFKVTAYGKKALEEVESTKQHFRKPIPSIAVEFNS